MGQRGGQGNMVGGHVPPQDLHPVPGRNCLHGLAGRTWCKWECYTSMATKVRHGGHGVVPSSWAGLSCLDAPSCARFPPTWLPRWILPVAGLAQLQPRALLWVQKSQEGCLPQPPPHRLCLFCPPPPHVPHTPTLFPSQCGCGGGTCPSA